MWKYFQWTLWKINGNLIYSVQLIVSQTLLHYIHFRGILGYVLMVLDSTTIMKVNVIISE